MTVIDTSSADPALNLQARRAWTAIKRGWSQTCPACGDGGMYGKYLKVRDVCPSCGEELHHQRADDAPPYFVILIVAHIIGAFILLLEQNHPLNAWIEGAISMALVVVMSLWLLPRVKGALIAYQWAYRMHGFGPGEFEGADIAPAGPLPAPTPY